MRFRAKRGVPNNGQDSNEDWHVCIAHACFQLILIVKFVLSCGVGAVGAQSIWLAPQGAYNRAGAQRPLDFLDMFKSDDLWRVSLSKIRVFKLYGRYIDSSPPSQLEKVIAFLKQRKIVIALEIGSINGLADPRPTCGGPGLVEGYVTADAAFRITQKLKSVGADVQYFSLDEPLWYGHYYQGKVGGQPGCKTPLEPLLHSMKIPLSIMLSAFPAAEIGQIEPTILAMQGDGREKLLRWASLFKQEIGRPLDFIHLDVPWLHHEAEKSLARMVDIAEELRRENLVKRRGVIVNGSGNAGSDLAWIDSARRNAMRVCKAFVRPPDEIIVQSWDPWPTRVLPESSPTALTSLISGGYGSCGGR